MDDSKWIELNEKGIANFDFLTETEGAYCRKVDANGHILQYAYISADLSKLVILKDINCKVFEVHDWSENQNESHKVITQFLSELTFRPFYMKGTPFEQEHAKSLWHFCVPQNFVSKSLMDYVEINILQNNLTI